MLLLSVVLAVSYEAQYAAPAEAGVICDGRIYFDVRLGSTPNPTQRWTSYDAVPGEAVYVGLDLLYYPCFGIEDPSGGLNACDQMAMSDSEAVTFYDSRRVVTTAPASSWRAGGYDHCKLSVPSYRWTFGVDYYDFEALCPCQGERLQSTESISRFLEWRDLPPIITFTGPLPASSGWQQLYSMTFLCEDRSGAGIDWAAPDGGCSGSESIATEGYQQSLTLSSTDLAGHTTLERIDFINIDRTPPSITARVTNPSSPDLQGWYRGPVTVEFTCVDQIRVGPIAAGIATCPAPIVLSSSGAGQSAFGTAYDRAGNAANAEVTGININLGAPTITGAIVAPAPPASGWYTTPPTVRFTCGAGGGVIASCSGDVVVSTQGANQSVTGTVTDTFGGRETATVSGINVQTSRPTIVAAQLSNRLNDGTATVRFTCTSLSGFDPGACPPDEVLTADSPGGYTSERDGQIIHTKYSASHTVTDRAGLTSLASYEVQVEIVPSGSSSAVAIGTPTPGDGPNAFIGDVTVVLDAVAGTRTPQIFYSDAPFGPDCFPGCGEQYVRPLVLYAPQTGSQQYVIYYWSVNLERVEPTKILLVTLTPQQPMQVYQMAPEEGPMAGGTQVTIDGSGFFGGGVTFTGRVHFGQVPCPEFDTACGDATIVSASDSRLVVLSPAPVGTPVMQVEYAVVRVILRGRCIEVTYCSTGAYEPMFAFRAEDPNATTTTTTNTTTTTTTTPSTTTTTTPATTTTSTTTTSTSVPETSTTVPGTMPPEGTIDGVPQEAVSGGRIVASARGFQPGEPVDFAFNSEPIDLGSAVADAGGVATLDFLVPVVDAGQHTVTATGRISGVRAAVPIIVESAPSDSGSMVPTSAVPAQDPSRRLPTTGGTDVRTAGLAVGMLLIGFAVVALVRRPNPRRRPL